MDDLKERIRRYVSDDLCECTNLGTHLSKLDHLAENLSDLQSQLIVLKALSDENRLKIVKLLDSTDLCACELEFILGVSQPTVAYHLQILRKAGLIVMEREGKWTSIKLKNTKIIEFIHSLA